MKIKVVFLSVLVGIFFFNVTIANSADIASGEPGRSPAVEPVMGLGLPLMPAAINPSAGFDFTKNNQIPKLSPMDRVFNLNIFFALASILLLPFMAFFGIRSWLENRKENSGWLTPKTDNVVDLSSRRKDRENLKKAA